MQSSDVELQRVAQAAPLAMLDALVHACAEGQAVQPAAALWFLDGVRRALQRGEPLDLALGLSGGPGQRTLARQVAKLRRDAALRRALDAVAIGDVPTWTRCQRLADLLPQALRVHRQYAALPVPPDHWPTWRRHVHAALQTGLDVPVTARGLRELANGTPGYSLRDEPGTVLACLLDAPSTCSATSVSHRTTAPP